MAETWSPLHTETTKRGNKMAGKYKCEYCRMSFRSLWALRSHKKAEHGGKH